MESKKRYWVSSYTVHTSTDDRHVGFLVVDLENSLVRKWLCTILTISPESLVVLGMGDRIARESPSLMVLERTSVIQRMNRFDFWGWSQEHTGEWQLAGEGTQDDWEFYLGVFNPEDGDIDHAVTESLEDMWCAQVLLLLSEVDGVNKAFGLLHWFQGVDAEDAWLSDEIDVDEMLKMVTA